jgi:hypothetical protein
MGRCKQADAWEGKEPADADARLPGDNAGASLHELAIGVIWRIKITTETRRARRNTEKKKTVSQ